MMKVLFLDIDGVLNYEGCTSFYGGVYFVTEEKLRLLVKIVNATKAKIVLISTWRQGLKDLSEGKESFEAGLTEALLDTLETYNLYIFDYTKCNGATRGKQIEDWIYSTGETIESFVILDDLDASQFEGYEDHLVQTDMRSGLEPYHVVSAIQILNC